MRTKERLAQALEAARCPLWMVEKARAGGYDDYESDSPIPLTDLVRDLRAAGGQQDLIRRAVGGEFDGTREEAEAWAASPEGQAVLRSARPDFRQQRTRGWPS